MNYTKKYNNLEDNIATGHTIKHHITIDDAMTISQWIKIENENNGKHMLEKTPQEILDQSNNNFCCKAIHNDKLIGFINAMKVQYNGFTLLETGSIIVHPDYQNMGIGFSLKNELIENINSSNKDLPIYSVSNQKAIMKINYKLNRKAYTKLDIPKAILETIESAGELLDDDIIYINNSLFKLFNQIK